MKTRRQNDAKISRIVICYNRLVDGGLNITSRHFENAWIFFVTKVVRGGIIVARAMKLSY